MSRPCPTEEATLAAEGRGLSPRETGPLGATGEPPVHPLFGTERQAAEWLASAGMYSQPAQDEEPRTVGERTVEAGGCSSPSVSTSLNTADAAE